MKNIRILLVIATSLMFGALLSGVVTPEYGQSVFVIATLSALFFGMFVKLPKGVLAASPSATSGDLSGAYISVQDIGLPKWYSTLVNEFGDQGMETVGMVQALGWTSKASTKLIQHYEDDWIWDNFKVGAQGGGGATATLTIDATSIYNGKFFPIVGDIIEFPNKDASGNPIQARVESLTSNTITIKVAKSTWTVPATTEGQALFVGTNLSAEGTGQPSAKRTRYNLYQNTFARVKTSTEMTGDAMTEQLKFQTYELTSGKKATGIVSLASLELDVRQMKAEQYAFLSGQKYDNIEEDGKTIEGTEGMFAAMKRASIQFPYTVWGMASYDVLEKSLSGVYAGQISGMLLGIDLDITNENVLTDFLKHTNVDYITKTSNKQLFGDNEGAAIAVGFNYIEKAKRKIGMKRLTCLQDPKQYGTVGYDYASRAIVLPLKGNNIDPQTKAKVPSMRTVYRSLDGYDREKEMFTTGSANVARYGNTDDVDTRKLNCRSQFGAEFFGLAQWVDIFQN